MFFFAELIEKKREEVNEEIAKLEQKFRSEIKAIEEGLHEIPEIPNLKHDRNNRDNDDNDNDNDESENEDYGNSDVENEREMKQEKISARDQNDDTMDTTSMTNEESLYDNEAKNLKITVKYEKHSDDDDEAVGGFSRKVVHDESRDA
jgi:hypothetical protein